MLYIGYLIHLDGKNRKKSVLEISIFEPPRLEDYTSRLLLRLLPPPPPPHPNAVKITKRRAKTCFT